MTALFFSDVLLPGGWATSVRVSIGNDGRIDTVTPGADADGCEQVSGIAVPGVPNLHSHAFQRAMAGLAERGSPRGDSFWGWRERMYAFLERLDPDDVEAIAAQVQLEMLRHGYTFVGEFHYLRNAPDGTAYADPVEMARRVLAAAELSGIGVTILPALYRQSDFGGAPPTPGQRRFLAPVEALLQDIAVLRTATAGHPAQRVGMAIHSLRAVTPEDLSLAVGTLRADDATAPIHIHVAEQQREVDACLAWSGARPVEWLLGNASVDYRWCAIHATHMTLDETRSLAATGAVAGLCPTTEANLGDGVFAFGEYVGAGGPWGVGTDSHVSVSPVADLRLLEYSQRLVTQERNVAAGQADRSTGRALLEGAWAGGARACGQRVGSISVGARADIVVLDRDHPALVGRREDEVLDSWIFGGEDTPVRDVMVGGAWVVTDGRHDHEEAIATGYRAVAERLRR
ncbi:MAG: formimidoylglutamate deiminase [Gemmatimonadota bacterium]|nr:formimidoylglutamate deiminase [Gemmatimonadota bacterium]